jgi:hypothetical protein
MRFWALDDLVLSNGATDDLNAFSDDLLGLPKTRARMVRRYGRHPKVSGVDRQQRKFAMTATLPRGTGLAAARRRLLQYLNPDREETRRLVLTDGVVKGLGQTGVLLQMGPWDVYDDDGTWKVRDNLLPDTIEGMVTGGLHCEDGVGARERGIVMEIATTNEIVNGSFEVDVADWATAEGGETLTRDTTEYKFGVASFKVVTPGANPQEGVYSGSVVVSVSQNHTASAWFKAPATTALRLTLEARTAADVAIDSTNTNFVATGDWQRVTVTHSFGATGAKARVYLTTNGTVTGLFYADGVQLEQNQDYATTYADGSLGPGYTWSGTPHASSSARVATEFNLDAHVDLISEKNTLSLRIVAEMPYDADGTWPGGIFDVLMDSRGAADSARIMIRYDGGADTFGVYINGDYRLNSAVQTFDAGDWLDIVVTIDFENDAYVLYIDGAEEDTYASTLSPPTLTEFNLGSGYTGATQGGFTIAEFDVFGEVLSAAEVSDLYDGGVLRSRWLDVICESAPPFRAGRVAINEALVALMTIDRDVRLRQRDGDATFWRAYDDTWSCYVTNDGDDDVYPEIRITPITAKTGGYAYKRFVPVVWRADRAHARYPYDLTDGGWDTTPLTPAKMQADGDDLRVFVDDVEVDRWLADMDTANTKVWINLNVQAGASVGLEANIEAGDTVTSIDGSGSISDFPDSGILLIDDEVFTYTSKNDTDNRFLGVTRAAKGSTAAAHTTADTIYWVQNDIWILYGDSTATAPTVDDDYKPIFDLSSSTNTSWVYAEFGEDDTKRAGQWSRWGTYGSPTFYGGNRTATADPWVELGITCEGEESGFIWLGNPCRITNVNFTNGDKRAAITTRFVGRIISQGASPPWVTEYTIPDPTTDNVWEPAGWSQSQAISTTGYFVALEASTEAPYTDRVDVEAADCTVTLNGSYTPTMNATMFAVEQGAYTLACTIENTTTEDSISIAATLALNETLVIDTYSKTVNYNGVRIGDVLTVDGGARRDWLRLIEGDNALTFEDTGTNGVEIDVLFERRVFE